MDACQQTEKIAVELLRKYQFNVSLRGSTASKSIIKRGALVVLGTNSTSWVSLSFTANQISSAWMLLEEKNS